MSAARGNRKFSYQTKAKDITNDENVNAPDSDELEATKLSLSPYDSRCP